MRQVTLLGVITLVVVFAISSCSKLGGGPTSPSSPPARPAEPSVSATVFPSSGNVQIIEALVSYTLDASHPSLILNFGVGVDETSILFTSWTYQSVANATGAWRFDRGLGYPCVSQTHWVHVFVTESMPFKTGPGTSTELSTPLDQLASPIIKIQSFRADYTWPCP
jgi:hypothetical protein